MRIVVIGAGASGMMAAIQAAKKGASVTILEHKDKIGKKLLATGNGRCNLTNEVLKDRPWEKYLYDNACSEKIKTVFEAFGYEDTMDFFHRAGILTKDRNGLVYPYSDQASSVLDALRFLLRDLGVNIICECDVTKIIKNRDGFEIKGSKGVYRADRLIIATGSKAQSVLGSDGSGYELLRNLGHKITTVTPGLVQLKCKEDYYKSIAGVRIAAGFLLSDGEDSFSESGELQLTQSGISGIAVMNLSNRIPFFIRKGKRVSDLYMEIDLMEKYDREELVCILSEKCMAFPKRRAEELLNGILPGKLAGLLIRLSDIDRDISFKDIGRKRIDKLAGLIKGWRVFIRETNGFEQAQICLGGVSLKEVDEHLESKLVKGLFITGELLDIHGDCGGFNLQFCWSSGSVAGYYAAED